MKFVKGCTNTSCSMNKKKKTFKSNINFCPECGSKLVAVCKTKNCYQVLDDPETDTMVIATPWSKKKTFYYNQKINCMRASGSVEFDGKIYTFNPRTDFGTLDWGARCLDLRQHMVLGKL